METIKKTIFAALIVAIMGIFVTKPASYTAVNDLLDQNVEALALEDPYYGIIIEYDEWVQSYWVNTWSPGDGRLLHTTTCQYKEGTGNPTGQCSIHVIIVY